MPKTWLEARQAYCYWVDLSCYRRAGDFPGFFERERVIRGDGGATIEFEDYFRRQASARIEVWYEVAFWKIYSWRISWRTVDTIVGATQQNKAAAHDLWTAVQKFTEAPTRENCCSIRRLLGLSTDVLAVPLTFVAFAKPSQFPMIDKKVAKWVNENWEVHNTNRDSKLRIFKTTSQTSLRARDFESYLCWVCWCREVATVLSELTKLPWRARDVEMAVFTAYDKKSSLSILP